jgi:hypothetical protein
MAQCPKCKSSELEVSQSVVIGCMGVGAQVGSISCSMSRRGIESQLAAIQISSSDEASRPAPKFWNEIE